MWLVVRGFFPSLEGTFLESADKWVSGAAAQMAPHILFECNLVASMISVEEVAWLKS